MFESEEEFLNSVIDIENRSSFTDVICINKQVFYFYRSAARNSLNKVNFLISNVSQCTGQRGRVGDHYSYCVNHLLQR